MFLTREIDIKLYQNFTKMRKISPHGEMLLLDIIDIITFNPYSPYYVSSTSAYGSAVYWSRVFRLDFS